MTSYSSNYPTHPHYLAQATTTISTSSVPSSTTSPTATTPISTSTTSTTTTRPSSCCARPRAATFLGSFQEKWLHRAARGAPRALSHGAHPLVRPPTYATFRGGFQEKWLGRHKVVTSTTTNTLTTRTHTNIATATALSAEQPSLHPQPSTPPPLHQSPLTVDKDA